MDSERTDLEEYFLSLIRGQKRGAWPCIQRMGLWALSVPYGWITQGRIWLFDRGWKKTHEVSVPVISVGNLTLGGTGKTPCVEYVARYYRNRDLRVALLSRGYGTKAGPNDEALVLEENLPDVPHLQGKDRVGLAQVAMEELESEVLVLDDGFQHQRLRRNLDLVLIDATNPWGYGYLFPRGLLRERPQGLRRAQVAMITRCDLVPKNILDALKQRIQNVAPGIPMVETAHKPAAWINANKRTVPLETLNRRPLAGFCGIGNPDAFRSTLTNLGAKLVDWRVFPDHHAYTRDDVESLRTWARQLPPDTILATTQKDLVKIRMDRLGDREVWALQIQLEVVQGKVVLDEKLEMAVSGL